MAPTCSTKKVHSGFKRCRMRSCQPANSNCLEQGCRKEGRAWGSSPCEQSKKSKYSRTACMQQEMHKGCALGLHARLPASRQDLPGAGLQEEGQGLGQQPLRAGHESDLSCTACKQQGLNEECALGPQASQYTQLSIKPLLSCI